MTTSFRNLFRGGDINRVEIPIIQRDYAQGRQTEGVPRIRKEFLKVLHSALTGGGAVGLDFIFGEVENSRLVPLDGQQRLTTLFLLHWYLAARSGTAGAECDFLTGFTYNTRFSARDFCTYLVSQRPPFSLPISLGEWLRDQHGYASVWRHDPTIQSMLVVLDEIHALFADADEQACRAAWQALTDEAAPAISFEILSLKGMGLTDELYIKMNSRGKPLTSFEHFKANFEQTLREASDVHREEFDGRRTPYEEFIVKIDQDWSDLLWPLRDGDDIIDDEFLRLFRFLTDMSILRMGLGVPLEMAATDISRWAELVYGKEGGKSALSVQRYLFDALDSLHRIFAPLKEAEEITAWFSRIFTSRGYRPGAVAIFDNQLDLFASCCEKYGLMSGKNRLFGLPRTLLLFTVLEFLMTSDLHRDAFAERLRTIRNLVFASEDEIRVENFHSLLNETAKFILQGDLASIHWYNKRQIDEEHRKAIFLAQHPGRDDVREALYALEDHDLLRGCLAAFDLEASAEVFIIRARTFQKVFNQDEVLPVNAITAALLACGDYSQEVMAGRFQFGSADASRLSVWRELLTSPTRPGFQRTKNVLLRFLDEFARTPGISVTKRLKAIADSYLSEQEGKQLFDWRYYLVKYPAMRSGASGLYVSASGAMGFDLCMMRQWQMNSNYQDPYLLAVIRESGAKEETDVEKLKHTGWDGYKPDGRWIELVCSAEKLMGCRVDGFQLATPSKGVDLATFKQVVQRFGAEPDLRIPIDLQIIDGHLHDRTDRVLVGARLLREILACRVSDAAGT